MNYPLFGCATSNPSGTGAIRYTAEEDERSPFFGQEHSEFDHAVYDHIVHPQWDAFGSSTLYLKLLFVDYDGGFAIIELIGEWNDLLHNDIMFLKRDFVEPLMGHGISRFILIGENVLNFHASDEEYYNEWYEEAADGDGWIACSISESTSAKTSRPPTSISTSCSVASSTRSTGAPSNPRTSSSE